MMECVSISKKWFDEIKDEVKHENAYEVTEGPYKGQVEVDVEIESFERVSKEQGWMI
jgi:hypothetical protein